ncbi:MAG: N-acetylmuramoyl-L-alanine amidase [Gemmatimonadota bacterium]
MGWLVCAAGGLRAQSGERASAPETVRVRVSGKTLEIPVRRHRGYAAARIEDLLGPVLTDAAVEGLSLRARLGGEPISMQLGSPFVRRGNHISQLANPPYRADGAYWVPVELLADGGERAGSGAPPPRARGPLRVVIDPGHGGKDPGTRGRTGVREKAVTLAIARALRDRLAGEAGVEPFLTRDRDMYVSLRERSRRAVARRGDLFVSIHANWNRNRRARGFETYFLSVAKTENARQVALRENSAAEYDDGDAGPEPGDLGFILAGLDRNENIQEARRVAGYVQNALRRVRSTPDRGVKQAGFWVLVGASGSMPAVLVEVGFLSNSGEERVLRSAAGQRQVADAIADGVLAYRHYLERYDRAQAQGARP